MEAPAPKPQKVTLAEYEKDIKLWSACSSIHMRSGEVIEVDKVLSVLRYVVVVRVAGETILISKHAVDKAVLRHTGPQGGDK